MSGTRVRFAARKVFAILGLVLSGVCGCSKAEPVMEPKPPTTNAGEAADQSARELTHEETVAWIGAERAWRRARKTRPMWARAVTADEIGKEFQTADRAVEKARAGAWLCVGIANEPWFQSLEKIEAKYERGGTEMKKFEFDEAPREYQLFQPRPGVMNWAACVRGPGIAGFSIRPGYDPTAPLHSAAGGYVVKGDVADPYQDKPDDIWLVQESLFETSYEFVPDDEPQGETSGESDPR